MVAQANMLRATRLELGFVMLGALGGTAASVWPAGPGAMLSVLGFLGAVMASGYIARARPERDWYDGRAAAESCKTLAWRYAVGGRPFSLIGADLRAIDEAFVRTLREVLAALPFATTEEGVGAQITDDMRALRSAPLAARRQAYERGRIADQQDWYAARARFNDRRGRAWRQVVVALELGGLAAGIASISGVLTVDLMGIIAAAAAGGTAWLQLRQHEGLARAYSVATGELSAVRSLIRYQESEESWADFVDQSEEAISREHTLWRASRGVMTNIGLPSPSRGDRLSS
jgi:hypothetical protein